MGEEEGEEEPRKIRMRERTGGGIGMIARGMQEGTKWRQGKENARKSGRIKRVGWEVNKGTVRPSP